MKKFVKAMSVFAALAMLGAGFISCSSDDDDDKKTETYKCDGCGTEYDSQAKKDACDKQEGCKAYKPSSDNHVTDTLTISATTAEKPAFVVTSNGAISSVAEDFSNATINSKYGTLKDAAWGTQNYTFNADSTKHDSFGYKITSDFKDASTRLDVTKDDVLATVDFTFVLAKTCDVSVELSAWNSQSSSLQGVATILDSTGAVKATKDGEATGLKEDAGASVNAESLAAGTYTVRFAWKSSKDSVGDKGMKAFNGGVSGLKITATSK
ncbi:MAG: hypothetical protein KBT11_09730 [Treponema sp.]|nr:hypothetical protein [Candidatus Treponema equifaecale]